MKKILSLLALAMMSIVSIHAESVVFGFSESDFPLTAGTSFDVEDSETGETVVTLTVGFAGGADFKFKGNTALKADYGFTGFTEGNGENGTATSGTTYIIKPLYDGDVTVGIVLNAGKKFYVLESEQAMDGYDGMTVDAKVTGGTYSFPVKAGRTYKVFCTGSKLGFYGFAYSYDPSKVQTDVDVVVTDEVKIGDDIYMTYSCDKALDFSAVEGLTAYSVKKNITGDFFTGIKAETELTELTKVPAGAGVLLKTAVAGKYVVPLAKGSVSALTANDLKVVGARTALADMQTLFYDEVQKGPGILGTKTYSYFDFTTLSSKEVTVTGFVMLDKGEKEYLEAGTVYMDFDCDFDKGGAEADLNYTAYHIGSISDGEEQAVELNSIAELKAHNDNGLVKLNLFSAKVTYSDGNNFAVVEDYSGATVIEGLGKLVAAGDDLYGSLTFNVVVIDLSAFGGGITRSITLSDSSELLNVAGTEAEPMVVGDDNIYEYIYDYDWRYVKFSGVTFTTTSGERSVYIDLLEESVSVMDLLGANPEYPADGEPVDVVGYLYDYLGGTYFQPVKIGADEPQPQVFRATFVNVQGWTNVYACAYSDGEEPELPGTKLSWARTETYYNGEFYQNYAFSTTAMEAPQWIIFSNGEGEQTKPLAFVNGKEYIIDEADIVTGINTVNADNAETVVYNMQGLPVENVRKGLYIVGGKKMLVK